MGNFEASSFLDAFIYWIVFIISFWLCFYYLHWGIKYGDCMVSESQPRVVAVGSLIESFCVGLWEIFAPWSQFRSSSSDGFCFCLNITDGQQTTPIDSETREPDAAT